MSVFDGDIIRIRALRKRRFGGTFEDVRYAYTDREATRVIAGLKGTKYEPAVAVQVDELHYVVHARPDLSFGEEWE